MPILSTQGLTVVITGAVLIVALFKSDSKDVPTIVETVFKSNLWAFVGWLLFLVTVVTSAIVMRLGIRIHDKEIVRITKERDRLQERLLGETKGKK